MKIICKNLQLAENRFILHVFMWKKYTCEIIFGSFVDSIFCAFWYNKRKKAKKYVSRQIGVVQKAERM